MAGVTDVWTGSAALTADECRRLLAGNRIGRLAITVGALPSVVPVQYVLRGDELVLRTPGHHDGADGIDGQVVAFQTDDLDLDRPAAWCVSVTGTARVAPDALVDLGPVHPWFDDGVALAIGTELVEGHRVVL